MTGSPCERARGLARPAPRSQNAPRQPQDEPDRVRGMQMERDKGKNWNAL